MRVYEQGRLEARDGVSAIGSPSLVITVELDVEPNTDGLLEPDAVTAAEARGQDLSTDDVRDLRDALTDWLER